MSTNNLPNSNYSTPNHLDEWNDSLKNDFLWSNVNFGEAVSEVMTPFTWSLLKTWREEWPTVQDLRPFGNVGGRLYMNVSYSASLLALIGKRGQQALVALEDALHMPIPAGIDIPIASLSFMEGASFILKFGREQMRWMQIARALPGFLAANPAWCREIRSLIQAATDEKALAQVWEKEIQPRSVQAYLGVLSSAMRFTNYVSPVRQELTRLVGADHADALISNLSSKTELLASLGPLAGLAQAARGKISQEEYIERYGHRGPNEWEVFTPRPVEDPQWLEAKLAEYRQSNIDIDAQMAKQRQKFEAAWQQLHERYPGKARRFQRQIDEIARRGRLREAARSELVRVIWVLRTWVLRTGELTGVGEAIFFLSTEETLRRLSGDETVQKNISPRQEAYAKYRALPPYPSIINGSFDPPRWAADPQRSNEIYDVHAPVKTAVPISEIIRGSAGSAGHVEGIVRVIESLAQGEELRPGEILVTALTDIGWTPLFPRSAAVITDVGAALSHAAIVARELGIPAVVGCGNATARLKTGDRVLVDGGQGTVKILAK